MSENGSSPYEAPGRLADVIAAVTVMGAHRQSEGTIDMWARRLSRSEAENPQRALEIKQHWLRVFREHPEFFLAYTWQNEDKAALRLRYANKTIDPSTGETHARFGELSSRERDQLTTLPLEPAMTSTLINTAIALHAATLARKADARFFVPILVPSAIALAGIVLSGLLTAALRAQAPPSPTVFRVEGEANRPLVVRTLPSPPRGGN